MDEKPRRNRINKSKAFCSVPQCKTYFTQGISMHSFPKNEIVRKKWQNTLKITRRITDSLVVCSKHFKESDYFRGKPASLEDRYSVDWVPSLHMGSLNPIDTKNNQARHRRKEHRGSIIEEKEAAEEKKIEAEAAANISSYEGTSRKQLFRGTIPSMNLPVSSFQKIRIERPETEWTPKSENDSEEEILSSNYSRLEDDSLPLKATQIEAICKQKISEMPGCAVVGCKSRPGTGISMRTFPKNPERRREWTSLLMRQDGWQPTKHSCICELHFKPCMWEKTREDGTRRLKLNAIPTILNFSKAKPSRKPAKLIPIAMKPEEMEVTPQIFGFYNAEQETASNERGTIFIKEEPVTSEDVQVITLPNSIPSTRESITPTSSSVDASMIKEEPMTLEEVQVITSSVDTTWIKEEPITLEEVQVITSGIDTTLIKEEPITIDEVHVVKSSVTNRIPATSESITPTLLETGPGTSQIKKTDVISTSNAVEYSTDPLNEKAIVNRPQNCEDYKKILRKNEKLELKVKNLQMRLMDKTINLKHLKQKLNCIQKENAENKGILKTVFNDDQILSMKKHTKLVRWSNVTIKKALKLKSACGTSGYEELLNNKFPLPSLRTLVYRQKELKCSSEEMDRVFEFINLKVKPTAEEEKFVGISRGESDVISDSCTQQNVDIVNSLRGLPENADEVDVPNSFPPVPQAALYNDHNYSLQRKGENETGSSSIPFENYYGVKEVENVLLDEENIWLQSQELLDQEWNQEEMQQQES